MQSLIYIIIIQIFILQPHLPCPSFSEMSIVTFSTDDYVVPEWSSQPKYAYHFEIIKQGSIMGNINIKKKAFILIGRNEDLCDLFIDNPSISRKHAILQFKKNDDCPYLYDLGSAHGSQVNHRKLPPRAYQKLKPFDMIKFGVSSRSYILRCPESEHKQLQKQYESQNKFRQLMAEKNRQLSKQQLKDKYIQMLENDPYFKANNLSKKLQGASAEANRKVNGVDWGISDEYEVYAYRSESQYQIEPDVIRRLPGINQVQLNKISQFQTNSRKYEQIESELNELVAKQKRQYGLQQKFRDKKEKLEKKFVQAVEQLEKSQDWIRVNIFGQAAAKVVKKQQMHKQDDTFEDDQFLDRTLANKRLQKEGQQKQKNQQKDKEDNMFTTQDFWKLEKEFRWELKNLIALEKQVALVQPVNGAQDKQQGNVVQQMQQQNEEDDDLDDYMKQNNEALQKQQKIINNQRIRQSLKKIEQIKDYLTPLIGEQETSRIENQERGIAPKKGMSQQEKKLKKSRQNKKRISDVLDRLDVIKQTMEEVDEEDLKIFEYYKNDQEENEENEGEHRESTGKRERPQQLDVEQKEFQKPAKKFYPGQRQENRDQEEEERDRDQFYDLTKYK